ncbi:OmpA domain-containing protein [Psychromonas sp. CNPT3]|uniref:peptidoglycan-associated lipoprotein Pal n=1 Tax=Psychromonas sp. CNPT3 TaxID=314282 RepID=UPI00006E484C|nr:peptidoglycan-associated lipoprotein Pal [Psychromonas sp. CNPT3]AGH81809.1 OmpA domain-containing protein [Psychromonas sp. CNPT3]
MKISMISKSLLIALPMLALGACSSSSESDATSNETNSAVVSAETVETAVVDAMNLTDEEKLAKAYSYAILETTIQFDYDTSVLKARYTKILDAHAKFLVDHPTKLLTIEGNTDERGTPEYNIALGERRAMSVSTYLENMGVTSKQISIVSYGEEKPVNLGHDAAARAENRRAELTY